MFRSILALACIAVTCTASADALTNNFTPPVPTSSATQSYELHALVVPDSVFSIARDINAQGVVMGRAQFADGHWCAGTWNAGKWTALSTPGATDSKGYGINDLGDVVGIATINGVTHAALWRGGAFIDLGASQLDPGTLPLAYSVNNSGDLVGFDHDASFETVQAWIWSGGAKQNLAGIFGTTAAYRINNRGWIAGGAYYGGYATDAHPTLWRGGQQIDLGDPFGGGYSYADALNDRGQIAGEGVDIYGVWRGFLWDNGTFKTLLPTDDSLGSEGLDINNAADVVGDCFDYFVDHAVPTVWHKGVPLALGTEGIAYGINDRGTIVGYAPSGACYWSPVSSQSVQP